MCRYSCVSYMLSDILRLGIPHQTTAQQGSIAQRFGITDRSGPLGLEMISISKMNRWADCDLSISLFVCAWEGRSGRRNRIIPTRWTALQGLGSGHHEGVCTAS